MCIAILGNALMNQNGTATDTFWLNDYRYAYAQDCVHRTPCVVTYFTTVISREAVRESIRSFHTEHRWQQGGVKSAAIRLVAARNLVDNHHRT